MPPSSPTAVTPSSTVVPSPATEPTPTPTPTSAPSATVSPTPIAAARILTLGDTSRREVALTFDAGSDRGNAEPILDYLRDEGIRASFGMTGTWAEANADLVARMAAEGHVLMNHTWDHPHMETLTTAARLEQLRRTNALVRSITGVGTRPWFRPPYGTYDQEVLADVASGGYTWSVMWTVDSLGWQGLAPRAVTRRCLDGAEPGAIYLLHVGSQSTDWDALPAIVAGLRSDGYTFVTVAAVVR